MVNFRDSAVLAQDQLALLKLSVTVDGLYMWEFVTTLYYEWHVIRGHRPYRWTIWIYSLARLATLMTVIIDIMPVHTNCQVWATIGFAFAYMAFAFSALLIILRIVAFWNRNKVVVALAAVLWSVNVSFLIYGIIQIRPSSVPVPGSCSITNVENNKATIISMFITDFILLVIMLVGSFRMGVRRVGTFALGRLLWKQGVIWLLLATTIEFLPVVFISLDLNDAFNVMFLMPSLVTMSIAATRMYRSLADFCSNDVAMDSENAPRLGRAVSNPKSNFTVPAPPKRMEEAVHTTREKYLTSSADQNVLHAGNDRPGQLHEEQDGLSFNNDVESDI